MSTPEPYTRVEVRAAYLLASKPECRDVRRVLREAYAKIAEEDRCRARQDSIVP